MEPPPRSLALDAHYCIMVRVAWPTEYKYASAIGCACWRAPLGIDSLPTTTCDRRPNAEPMASAFHGARRGDGRPSNKQRDKTTRTSALTEITPYKLAGAWSVRMRHSSSRKTMSMTQCRLWRVGRRSFTSGFSQNGAGASRLTPLPPSSLSASFGMSNGFVAAKVSSCCQLDVESSVVATLSGAIHLPITPAPH